ncbi:hypothetical protein ES288_A07G167300v1 [Gossypium darwinii]|uniref:Uncharacterized protein n=1 Tax=Gossypium darwinii TaxID=34276 RepID=A0A5D2FW59_GOSDA|nr:hypothetical protein ES288_A07G167300v1 [Gossypium darwinii]
MYRKKLEKGRNKQQPWWFSVCQIYFALNRWCRLSVCLIGGYFPIFECLYFGEGKTWEWRHGGRERG